MTDQTTMPDATANTPPDSLQNTAPTAAQTESATAQRVRATARRLGNPWLLAALLIAGLATWQWLQARQQLAQQQTTWDKRLTDTENFLKESRQAAKTAQDQSAILTTRLSTLEDRLAEVSELSNLQTVHRDLAVTRDLSVLAEIEHALTLASQQLRMNGDLSLAIATVQSADTRIAKSDKPAFSPIRKALARELEQLRKIPAIDLNGMSLRLENLLVGIDKLPLLMDARPNPNPNHAPAAKPSVTGNNEWWQRLSNGLWQEVKGLIRIERIDATQPILLPADQQFFVFENLKLRLLSARLALLARDQSSFRHELEAAQKLLTRHFNPEDKSVQNTASGIQQLAVTQIQHDWPTLNESLSAIRNLQQLTDKKIKP